MPTPKATLLFFVIFLLVFLPLVVPTSGLHSAYASVFRGGGNLLYGAFGSQGRVRFLPLLADGPVTGGTASAAADDDIDMIIEVENVRTGGWRRHEGSTRVQGYLPTAFTVALVLATPIPWRRRARALALALVLVSVYVALRVLVFLLWEFSGDGEPAFLSIPAWGRSILEYLYWVFVTSFAGCYLAPLPIWFLVCFPWRSEPKAQRNAAPKGA